MSSSPGLRRRGPAFKLLAAVIVSTFVTLVVGEVRGFRRPAA
jgi:hypothetical protein